MIIFSAYIHIRKIIYNLIIAYLVENQHIDLFWSLSNPKVKCLLMKWLLSLKWLQFNGIKWPQHKYNNKEHNKYIHHSYYFSIKKKQQYTLNLAIWLVEDNYFLFRYKVTGAVLFENFDWLLVYSQFMILETNIYSQSFVPFPRGWYTHDSVTNCIELKLKFNSHRGT